MENQGQNLLESIKEVIEKKYNGHLSCEEQRADLYVFLNGEEVSIKSISITEIIYENGETISLLDSDIHTLSYISNCI